MEDPVSLSVCGHTFDKKTIVPVLEQFHKCPICRKPANSEHLVPNYQLKSVIEHYQTTKK